MPRSLFIGGKPFGVKRIANTRSIPAFGGAPKAGQKGGGDTFGCVPCTPATIRALPLTHTLTRRGFIAGNRYCLGLSCHCEGTQCPWQSPAKERTSLRASHASVAILGMERIKLLFLSHGWDCFGNKFPRNDK